MKQVMSNTNSSRALPVLLRIYRVSGWWYFVPAPLLGSSLLGVESIQVFPLLSASCSLAFAYAVNGVYDSEHDSQVKNPYAGQKKVPIFITLAAYAPSIPVLLFLVLGYTSVWPLFSILAGFVYSVPPVRLKRWPFISDITNLAIFVPTLLYVKGLDIAPEQYHWVVWIVIQLEISQIIHCLQDIDEDRSRRLRNTVAMLGEVPSSIFIILLSVLSGYFAYSNNNETFRLLLCMGSGTSLLLSVFVFIPLFPKRKIRLTHRFSGMFILCGLFAITKMN